MAGANNFSANNNSVLARSILVGKVDHQIRENQHFTGRYYLNDAGIDNHRSFGIPAADPNANFTGCHVSPGPDPVTTIQQISNPLETNHFQPIPSPIRPHSFTSHAILNVKDHLRKPHDTHDKKACLSITP